MEYRDTQKAKVQALKDGQECGIFWFEEGGGIVHKCNGMLLLFSVPQYGGSDSYEGTFYEEEIDKLLDSDCLK